MSFEKISKSVLAEAEEKAKKIIVQAQKKRDEEIELFREESKRRLEDSVRAEEAEMNRSNARKLSIYRHNCRLELLSAKNEIIDTVFLRARSVVDTMQSEEYREMIETWLRSLPDDIGGTVRINTRDVAVITDDFLANINRNRTKNGQFSGIVNDKNIPRGCIIEGSDFSVDLTIEKKLSDIRKQHIGDIARELFET